MTDTDEQVIEDISDICTVDEDLHSIDYIPPGVSSEIFATVIINHESPCSVEREDVDERDPINLDDFKEDEMLFLDRNETLSVPIIDCIKVEVEGVIDSTSTMEQSLSSTTEDMDIIPIRNRQNCLLQNILSSRKKIDDLDEYEQMNYSDFDKKDNNFFNNERKKEERSAQSSKASCPQQSYEGEDCEADDEEPGGKKRWRRFTKEEVAELEKTFKKDENPSRLTLENLDEVLGIGFDKVRRWFAARRMKNSRNSKSSKGPIPSRPRTSAVFITEQLEVLENVYKQVQYPNKKFIEHLAVGLHSTEDKIGNWFKYQRKKEAKTKRKMAQTQKNVKSSKSKLPNHGVVEEEVSNADEPARRSALPGSFQSTTKKTSSTTPSKELCDRPMDNKTSLYKETKNNCYVCDRPQPEKNVNKSMCQSCRAMLEKYQRLRKSRRKVLCCHKGSELTSGCMGCWVNKYKIAMKRDDQTVQVVEQPAEDNNDSRSNAIAEPASPENASRRRSSRLNSRSFSKSLDEEDLTNDELNNDLELASSNADNTTLDLQIKLHLSAKLNMLRNIASKLNNPQPLETSGCCNISAEIKRCIDDIVFLMSEFDPVLFIKGKDNSPKMLCSATQTTPAVITETTLSNLTGKIESIEDVVKESLTRIRELDGRTLKCVLKDTSTQTDAFLLFPMSDRSGYGEQHSFTRHQETVQNNPTFNYGRGAAHCRVCDQIRPSGILDHHFICSYCKKYMDTLKMTSQPNRYPFNPRCAHRGTQARFGCKDCFVFRYITIMSGSSPFSTRQDQSQSTMIQSDVTSLTNAGVKPASNPLVANTSSKKVKSSGTVHPEATTSAISQNPLTAALLQGAVRGRRTFPEDTPDGSPMSCKSVSPLTSSNDIYLWCENCRHRKPCTRFPQISFPQS